jgi:pimeloyl-ACP methyl ester carboxylesterase
MGSAAADAQPEISRLCAHAGRPSRRSTVAGRPRGSGGEASMLRVVNSTRQQSTARIVGNSLGGWVALEPARRGRAQSVLALSPAGVWRSPRDLRRLLVLFRAGAALGRVKDMPNLAAHKRVRRILLLLMAEHADRMTPAQVAAAFKDIAGCTALPEILDGDQPSP